MKRSYIASQIDREYQMKQKYDKEKRFKEDFCKYCKNKNTLLCTITETVDGKCRCVEFERS